MYLELLARDAAAVEYEGPVLDARARNAAPEVLAELERAKLLALQIRGAMESRRRREAELSALFETAGDLAALRELDALLQALVRRARLLLGTDITYLTLKDTERGDTYMRVTDGSVSAAFQQLRLPPGAGLGGLVAEGGNPYGTANYARDSRFHHRGDIDAAVGEEGLVAILGVPLRLGSRVIGVLFAANRSERPFAREEVALLSSLAAHAAVAIDSARLLEETREAFEELNAASVLVRAHSEAVERAAAAHDRLADLVLRGGGVDDVAAAVTEVLGGELLVLDPEGRSLTSGRSPVSLDERAVADAVSTSTRLGRAVRCGPHTLAAVAAGAEQLGALVLVHRADLGDADQRILERSALVTALLLLLRQSVAQAEDRVRGELLDDLLAAPGRDPQGLRDRARRLDADLDVPHSVVSVRADGVRAQRLLPAAIRLASARGGLAGSHRGAVVLLLPGVDASAAARAVAGELGTAVGAPVTAGASGPATGPIAVAAAYSEAVRCLEALLSLGRAGSGASMQDLGFLGLVLGDGRDLDGFVQRCIGPLLDYDRRRGTDLVHTLEEYFRCGSSLTRTREALHVHVNTVTQRLDRIGSLLGPDWQVPERCLQVQLALQLHRARGGRPRLG
ncbi:MAG: helix-turn-helix domain-containing protein [Actinomycetota bacterium]|nr:helix-turn-helix domain-containing protein [Actinomycetota bacterium]